MYKKIFILLAILYFGNNRATPLLDIPSAKINYEVSYNGSSVHYLEPIVLQVSNLTSQAIIVDIPIGMLFQPEDTTFQSIVTTAPLSVSIPPKASKTLPIKGMCMQQSKSSGTERLKYTAIRNPDSKLLQLCTFIAKNNYQNSEAQQAVWTLMKNIGLDNIWGADTLSAKALIKEMAAITGMPIPPPNTSYTHNYYYLEPLKVEIEGEYEWQISYPRSIIIGMFSPNGTLVREIYKNTKETSGTKKIRFHFDPTVYDEPYYDFKLIFDNRTVKNQRLYVKS